MVKIARRCVLVRMSISQVRNASAHENFTYFLVYRLLSLDLLRVCKIILCGEYFLKGGCEVKVKLL